MGMISIRSFVAQDAPAIAAWMVRYPLWAGYGLTEARAIEIMERGLADRHILLTAVTGSDEPCGLAYVLPRGAFAFSPYMRWLAVRQDMTGSGVGQMLLNAAEQAALEYRADLFLLTAHFNTGAHRFYERHGYAQVGALPDYVVSGVTELIYWKRLHAKDGT